jgi:hypothetical protein
MNTLYNALFLRTVKVVLIFENRFLHPFATVSSFFSARFQLLLCSIICVFFATSNAFTALQVRLDQKQFGRDAFYLDTSVRVDESRLAADSCIDSLLLDFKDSLGVDSSHLEMRNPTDTLKSDTSGAPTSLSGQTKWSRKRRVDKKEEYLYPGISREQDKLALQMIHEVYSFDWDEADRVVKKMQKLELRNKLPPLSYLLLISMRVVRLQNGEFKSERDAAEFLGETERLVLEAIAIANPSKVPKEVKTTYLFIYSGIEGFSATLKIARNPLDAAMEGFNALKILEKLTMVEPQIKDVYLGLGMFYCAMAKAPAIIRGALNIVGRNVTFEKGVEYLRISAYEGKYTTETARQYLIQFLSPYMGNEVAEKGKIFHSLQQLYPKNPYYLFLELHEDICFHPEKIDTLYGERIKKKISHFRSDEFSLKRYAALVQLQYCYIDTQSTLLPDTGVILNEFSFYPIFLDALKEKKSSEIKKKEHHRRQSLSKNGARAAKMLEESVMSSNRKNFFSWYIRDALRP